VFDVCLVLTAIGLSELRDYITRRASRVYLFIDNVCTSSLSFNALPMRKKLCFVLCLLISFFLSSSFGPLIPLRFEMQREPQFGNV